MFLFLQTLGVLLLLTGMVVIFGHKKQRMKKTVVALCVLTIISAGVANMVLGWIPMVTEQITLTARGERSEKAQSDEVALVGVVADGRTYEINNAIEGKWFWQGDLYLWRNEKDARQPKGTTRSITLNIPIGAGRALIFHNNPWRGMVDITFHGETKTYDLYSEEAQNVQISIPATAPFYDNAIKVGRLALFGIILLALMAYPIYAVIRFSDEKLLRWVGCNWTKFFFLILAVIYIMLMQKNSIDGSLWGDEMEQLGWAYGDIQESASIFIGALYRVWVHCMPYGQENLLLLPQMFVAGSIYLCGVMGEQLRGKRFGVIFASTMSFSVVVAEQCAMEFRPYPILLFLTTLTAYISFCMQKEKERSILSIFLYGFVLALTMDSHHFGIVVAGLFIIFDLLLLLLKKRNLKWLFEFILPGAYGIYWLSTKFKANYEWLQGGYGSTSWTGAPTARKAFEIVKWLCNNSDILTLIALVGVVSIAMAVVYKVRAGTFDFNSDYINIVLTSIPFMAILSAWFISAKYIPNDTLLLDRYLISCEIFFLYFISVGIDTLITFACCVYPMKGASAGCTVFVVCALCLFNWTKITPWTIYPAAARSQNQKFRQAAEYLMSRNDIYSEDVLCIVDHYPESANQAMDYYLTQKGKRDPINHIEMQAPLDDPKLRDGQYKTIYVTNVYRGYRNNGALNEFLDKNYIQSDLGIDYVKMYVKKD